MAKDLEHVKKDIAVVNMDNGKSESYCNIENRYQIRYGKCNKSNKFNEIKDSKRNSNYNDNKIPLEDDNKSSEEVEKIIKTFDNTSSYN